MYVWIEPDKPVNVRKDIKVYDLWAGMSHLVRKEVDVQMEEEYSSQRPDVSNGISEGILNV